MQNDRAVAPSELVAIGAERLLWTAPQARRFDIRDAGTSAVTESDGGCSLS